MGSRDEIVQAIRQRMAASYEGEHVEAACLYWAEVAQRELRTRGERAVIQVGTMMWPRVLQDDGVSPTHFSYVWTGLAVEPLLSQGVLPEMHVWVALPERVEIVDVTTRYLVVQARKWAGLDWTAPPPPDYLWATPEQLPQGVTYRPEPAAIRLALRLLGQPQPAVMVRKLGARDAGE